MKEWLSLLLDDDEIKLAKDPKWALEFYTKAFQEMDSCDEAEQLFPYMLKCPVCLSVAVIDDEELKVTHRPLNWN